MLLMGYHSVPLLLMGLSQQGLEEAQNPQITRGPPTGRAAPVGSTVVQYGDPKCSTVPREHLHLYRYQMVAAI